MTRQEQIMKKVNEVCNDPYNDLKSTWDLCQMMAEWADKTMLDKICQWLDENMQDYANCVYEGEELTDEARVSSNLMKDLRKAMEE